MNNIDQGEELKDKDLINLIKFTIKKGENDCKRLASIVLNEVSEILGSSSIKIHDKLCKIKIIELNENEFIFDIIDPSEEYDHIEFKVSMTGFGRYMNTNSVNVYENQELLENKQ